MDSDDTLVNVLQFVKQACVCAVSLNGSAFSSWLNLGGSLSDGVVHDQVSILAIEDSGDRPSLQSRLRK
jgi:hypothetical protein